MHALKKFSSIWHVPEIQKALNDAKVKNSSEKQQAAGTKTYEQSLVLYSNIAFARSWLNRAGLLNRNALCLYSSETACPANAAIANAANAGSPSFVIDIIPNVSYSRYLINLAFVDQSASSVFVLPGLSAAAYKKAIESVFRAEPSRPSKIPGVSRRTTRRARDPSAIAERMLFSAIEMIRKEKVYLRAVPGASLHRTKALTRFILEQIEELVSSPDIFCDRQSLTHAFLTSTILWSPYFIWHECTKPYFISQHHWDAIAEATARLIEALEHSEHIAQCFPSSAKLDIRGDVSRRRKSTETKFSRRKLSRTRRTPKTRASFYVIPSFVVHNTNKDIDFWVAATEIYKAIARILDQTASQRCEDFIEELFVSDRTNGALTDPSSTDPEDEPDENGSTSQSTANDRPAAGQSTTSHTQPGGEQDHCAQTSYKEAFWGSTEPPFLTPTRMLQKILAPDSGIESFLGNQTLSAVQKKIDAAAEAHSGVFSSSALGSREEAEEKFCLPPPDHVILGKTTSQTSLSDILTRKASYSENPVSSIAEYNAMKIFTRLRGLYDIGWGPKNAASPGSNGRVDHRRLARFAKELDFAPFKQLNERRHPEVDFYIIMDNSGSMICNFDANYRVALKTASAIRKTRGFRCGIATFYHWALHPTEPVQNWRLVSAEGGTPMHVALRKVHHEIRTRAKSRKNVVIVFTDGEPDDRDLCIAAAASLKQTALVFGVYLCPPFVGTNGGHIEEKQKTRQHFAHKLSDVLAGSPACTVENEEEFSIALTDIILTLVLKENMRD